MSKPEPNTISLDKLAVLTGLSQESLKRLAAEGYFPRGRNVPLAEAVSGAFRYYKEKTGRQELQDAYDSIANCSAATGIPPGKIKAAKKSGCDAFKGSRVRLLPLLKFIFSRDEDKMQQLARLEQESRAREAKARADEAERRNAQQEGSVFNAETVRQVMRDALVPIRQRLMALPSEACHNCNPTDPQFAREALQTWVDNTLPMIRDGIGTSQT
jgi:hypothetical protein